MKRILTPKRITNGQFWYHKLRPLYLKMGWKEKVVEHENTIVCKLFPPKGWKEKSILIICCKDTERLNPERWKNKRSGLNENNKKK